MKLEQLVWPRQRIGEATLLLARQGRLCPGPAQLRHDPSIESEIASIGLEARAVRLVYGDLRQFFRRAGPTLLELPELGWLPIIGARGARLRVLAPDRRRRSIAVSELRQALASERLGEVLPEIEQVLCEADIPRARRPRARAVLLETRLATTTVGRCWQIRSLPGVSFAAQLVGARVHARIFALLLTHAARFTTLLAGWWLLGRGALGGHLDPGWLSAWALLLLTQIPLAACESWCRLRAAIDAGALLKRRLLAGALALPPEQVRSAGFGELLGRVIEAEAVEALALSGGLTALVSVLELGFAASVLASGSAGAWHVLALGAWTALTLAACVRYHRSRRAWTSERMSMTQGLVERMVGHRTRLSQLSPERWHDGEDEALERYVDSSRQLDRIGARLDALAPRGWLTLGLSTLLPWLVRENIGSASLAVSLGGILLAMGGLSRLVQGFAGVSGALIAWREVSALFHAAPQLELTSSVSEPTSRAAEECLLDARDIVFHHEGRSEPILRGCSLRVSPRDRILLEGSSGSGKSTFGSLLAGAREPASGLLLLGGLDRRTLGFRGWRQRVAAAPQFHENHVLTSSFAFNLLMGHRWPPEAADLELARAVCEELELGPLIARMPAGLWQMVGETGWQLSHGERSRLFIARALLQNADLIVLDESFAALDPTTLRRVFACVWARAKALVVIAHP